ncbi:MAG: PAS domain S-box-containing protein [Alteromonadaceae bacterium]|jgi:PAS domain S-box-containing protein
MSIANKVFYYAMNWRLSLISASAILLIVMPSYFYISTYFTDQFIKEQQSNITDDIGLLQNSVSYLFHQKAQPQLNNSMTLLDSKSDLIQAFVFDHNNIALASKNTNFTGLNSAVIFPNKQGETLILKQALAMDLLKTQIWIADEESIFALAPILSQASTSLDTFEHQKGYLLLQYSKTLFIHDKKQWLLWAFLPLILLFFMVTLILAYYFHSSIGLRVHRLRMTANKFLLDNGQSVQVFSDKDEFNALRSSFQHVTKWLNTVHEKLHNRHKYLNILLNSVTEGLIATDKKGHVKKMNSAAERLTWWQSRDAKTIDIDKVLRLYSIDNKSALINPFESVLVGKERSKNFEALLRTENNCEFIVNFSISPIYRDHIIDGIVIVLRDATDTHDLLKTVADTDRNYKNLFNLSRDGYVLNKGNGEILTPNPAYAKMLGYSCEELIAQSCRTLTPQRWLKLEGETYSKQLIERGYTDLYQKEYIHKNGSLVPVEIQAFLLNTAENLDDAIVGAFVRNITGGKEQDEYLRQYKYILSSSYDLIALINKEYQFKAVNNAFLSHFDQNVEQLLGKTVSTVIGKRNFNDYLVRNINHSLKGHTITFKIWADFKTVGKKYLDVTCSPYINEENEITGVVINCRDITQQKYRDDKSITQKREQEYILSSLVDGVITIDEEGIVLNINNAGELLFGYTKNEIVGCNVKMLMPKKLSKKHDGFIRNYLETGERKVPNSGREVIGLRKNSSKFSLQLYISELPQDESKQRRFIGICHDLSQLKAQEQKALRSQKMDALGKLTGGIAHDFNNMLGVILGYCEVLDKQLKDQPILAHYVDNIAIAGQRGADLTRKLLSFSKKKHAHKNIININQLIISQESILKKSVTALIDLTLDLNEELWNVNIDISSFDDMILNICINAMHAMPDRGDITIKTDNIVLAEDDSEHRELTKGKYVVLSIKDSGCGICDEDKDKIFEPFYTTKGDEGTGLGLSQVYGFVKSSGGIIKVESVINIGSNFIFYFPCLSSVEKTKIKSDALNDGITLIDTSKIILVVDDEPLLCELAKELLSENGFTVYSALSGEAALELLQSQKIDVMITDVIMPKMNGYELSDNVTMLYPSIKILLASGFQRDLAEKNMHQTASLPMITKPYNKMTLLKGIQTCLTQ